MLRNIFLVLSGFLILDKQEIFCVTLCRPARQKVEMFRVSPHSVNDSKTGYQYSIHFNVSENSQSGFGMKFGLMVVRNHTYENLKFIILVLVKTTYTYP